MDNIFLRFKNNKTLRNGTLFSMFAFINRGIAFLLMVILARYIMPGEYGQLSLFNTITQLLAYFITLSCQSFFTISYFQRKGELFRQDFTSIILITTGTTLLLSIVLFFFQDSLARFADLPPAFLWFAIIICVGEEIFGLLMSYIRIQEKVIRYGILSCGFAIINFIISIYLVVYKGLDWRGRVYTHLCVAVLSGLLGLGVLASKHFFTRHVTWEGTKNVLKWGVPLIPHNAAGWIKQGCDRFIINSNHSLAAVGIFSFALNLNSIIAMVGIAFNQTNSVTIYQLLSSDKTANDKLFLLKRQTKNIGLIYTISYVSILVLGTLLVYFAIPAYCTSLPYFWILSLSGYLNCLYYLFVNYLYYFHRNKNVMTITFTTALLHLMMSLLLTKYSLYWTAIIYVVTQGVVVYLTARQAIKVIRESFITK